MINWNLTTEKYNLTKETINRKSKVIVCCETCNNIREIVYQTFLSTKIETTICSSYKVKENRIKYKDNYSKSDKNRSITLSKTFKEKWTDIDYRNQQVEASKKAKLKQSENSKKLWKDNDYRLKVSKSIQDKYEDVEYKQKMAEIYASEEYRSKLRYNWKKAGYREKVLACWLNKEFIKNFSKNSSEILKEFC